MDEKREQCLNCERTSEQVPLIRLRYLDRDYWICPQDLPILIHKPEQLAIFADAYRERDAEE